MMREERRRLVEDARDAVIRKLDGTQDLERLYHGAMDAIVGAAALLNRDPVALADLLADGRLAEYIEAAEGTIPLSLDDPAPVHEPMEKTLQEAAEWMERERDVLERKLSRVLKDYDRTAKELRKRAHEIGCWKNTWTKVRSWVEWRSSRGL